MFVTVTVTGHPVTVTVICVMGSWVTSVTVISVMVSSVIPATVTSVMG